MFERFPSLRTLFAALWLAAQAALVLTSGGRLNHAFGFRMFEESTTVSLHVERLVDGGSLPISDEWTTQDCQGRPARYQWHVLVPSGPQWLDVPLGAPYGSDAGLARAQAAVAWVATHTPDDCKTERFVATVTRRRNGRTLDDVVFSVPR